MKNYVLELLGCDDSTTIVLALTAGEILLLERLVSKTHEKSTSHCMPVINIYTLAAYNEANPYIRLGADGRRLVNEPKRGR